MRAPRGGRIEHETGSPERPRVVAQTHRGDAPVVHGTSEKTARMLARWLEGETYAEIAADFGVSRQAVHRRIDRVATRRQRRTATRAGLKRAERRRREAEAARLASLEAAAREAGRLCPICDAPLLRESARTCGGECAERWAMARYRLDPDLYERHRIAQARTILRRPEGHNESEVEWARRMLSDDPPPPNRRSPVADSRASAIVREVRGEAA